MDTHLIFVAVLILLAAVDLTVGVANDAVNFLNSAVGSKASSFKVIMLIAALGVFVGVFFSSGMMEVARKGIFKPELFQTYELLVIFLAVMFQDIILLDLFNTFGLPTSTTVSIVFGLFGAGFVLSWIKIAETGVDFSHIFTTYLNSYKIIEIVGAIFLSIIVAFVLGSLIQYITRLIFSFDYKKRFRRYGAIWSGVALTMLTLFILIKGAKGSTFMDGATSEWIKGNLGLLSLYLFVGWAVVIQALISLTKINVLKIIVLLGTFALAMAFAANDLVNFIGAPLAGLFAYQFEGETSKLAGEVQAPGYFLLIAGAIMVITLFLSKKAKSVTKTTINLGRQDEGSERFESNTVARVLVRMIGGVFDFFIKYTPSKVRVFISSRFNLDNYVPEKDENGNQAAFDHLRAAVNLIVAAAIISFATTLKWPLSTTYVTFIVAMATALPDKAWGRESAVYRVSGVVTVVGGWFVTAMSASIVAGAIALVIYYGEIYGLIGFLAIAGFAIYRSTLMHRNIEKGLEEKEIKMIEQSDSADKALKSILNNLSIYFDKINLLITNSLNGISNYNLAALKSAKKTSKSLKADTDLLISDILKLLRFAQDDDLQASHAFAKSLGALQQITMIIIEIAVKNHKYVANHHKELLPEQLDEIKEMQARLTDIFLNASKKLEVEGIPVPEDFDGAFSQFEKLVKQVNKKQIKRIKSISTNTKRSLLYLNIIDVCLEITKNIKIILEASSGLEETIRENRVDIPGQQPIAAPD